jgi:hypothetical protein
MNSITVPRRSLLAALAGAAGTLALGGCASATWAHPQRIASLEIFDRDGGGVVPTYHRRGRAYVIGRPGARYALRVRNLTPERVLVVLSVDGVNVVTGETADWRQSGYVLDPWRSYDINGWRKSTTEVAAFEFAPIERSYAALSGRPGHVGVIGMAVFRERVVPPIALQAPPIAPRAERRSEGAAGGSTDVSRAAAAPAAPAAEARSRHESDAADGPASGKLGTGHGQREWSMSRRTHFERRSARPDEVVEIAYDSYERLAEAGIVPRPYGGSARPFPMSEPGYVPDPPDR